MRRQRMFAQYIGIDYSGAATPTTPSENIAVSRAEGVNVPEIIGSELHPKGWWTRQAVADWLVERLQEPKRTLVGIDHGFSFPVEYFNHYLNRTGLDGDWDCFLDDFQKCWQTDGLDVKVTDKYYDQLERMMKGEPHDCRIGRGDWFRLTDPTRAKSVFDFMGRGPVAHQTHAGLPWLRYIRRKLRKAYVKVHFWPFDGWDVPPRTSVVVEVYPARWNKCYDVVYRKKNGEKDGDKHDAYSIVRWMLNQDQKCLLGGYFKPELNAKGFARARKEGWILGVTEPRFLGYK